MTLTDAIHQEEHRAERLAGIRTTMRRAKPARRIVDTVDLLPAERAVIDVLVDTLPY